MVPHMRMPSPCLRQKPLINVCMTINGAGTTPGKINLRIKTTDCALWRYLPIESKNTFEDFVLWNRKSYVGN